MNKLNPYVSIPQSTEGMSLSFSSTEAYGLCRVSKTAEPCIFVILGATGDLANRKLLPPLFNLFINNSLPDKFFIIRTGRTNLSDEQLMK